MICDNCHERDAVVNLTKVKDGTVRQQHLCERCAAEQGVETTVATPKPALSDFLQAVNQQAVAAPGDQSACHFCGATARDFRQSGRVGCARCYNAFERSLRELLRRLHGNAKHTGRKYVPPTAAVLEAAGTLGQLRDELRRAIAAEQFELAAELRDRVRNAERASGGAATPSNVARA
ncbi:MAG TPA: UvrB/UvrC motif-containing protein [Gemmatirosa sp.]